MYLHRVTYSFCLVSAGNPSLKRGGLSILLLYRIEPPLPPPTHRPLSPHALAEHLTALRAWCYGSKLCDEPGPVKLKENPACYISRPDFVCRDDARSIYCVWSYDYSMHMIMIMIVIMSTPPPRARTRASLACEGLRP